MIPRTDAYFQSTIPAEKIITEKISEDSKSSQHNYKRTESDITAAFKLLFDKYNINNIDNLLNLIGGSITKEDLLVCKETVFQEKVKYIAQLLKENTIDKNLRNIAQKTAWDNVEDFNQEVKNKQNLDAIDAIKQQYKIQNNKEVSIENLSQDELKQLIKDYFEENYKQYLEKAGNDHKKAMKMLFGVMLAKTADKDKHLLLPIINEVIADSEVLDAVFNSFENGADATEFADSISYDEWKKLPNEELKVKYIQNMTQKGIDMQKLGYNANVEKFYKEHGEELIRIDAKLKDNPNCKLSDIEQSLLDQRDALIKDGSLMTAANFGNKNLTKDEMEANAKDIIQIAQKYGFEDEYLSNLADIIKNNNRFNLELPKDEIKDILDKITDKKFSKALDKIPEKTATDEKTGGFKNDKEADIIQASSDNAQKILKNITEKEEGEEDKTFVVEKYNNEKSQPKKKEKYTSLVQYIRDVITGKNNYTSSEAHDAIEDYTKCPSSDQINLLHASKSDIAYKLIFKTDISTIEKYLRIFGVANTYDLTACMKNRISENKDK